VGFDAVRGPDTYGSGCMPGCKRMFEWFQRTYDAGSLGCYNPASLGGKSLHAEGRAMDIALDARDPHDRERGDAIFAIVMAHPQVFGAQEMLWRGYLWSWQRRGEGKRGPGIQQADHMNHVHLGIDVDAAKNWTEDWLEGLELDDPEDLDMDGNSLEIHVVHALEEALRNSDKVKLLLARVFLDALKSEQGQAALREALK